MPKFTFIEQEFSTKRILLKSSSSKASGYALIWPCFHYSVPSPHLIGGFLVLESITLPFPFGLRLGSSGRGV